MQNLIYISGVLMPAPRTYSVSTFDLDSSDSGRNETGVMYRNRIRSGVYKLQTTFRVNRRDLNTIMDAIKEASFSVRFFDPDIGGYKTCTMYAGDKQSTMLLNSNSADETLWDFSVNFIEY